MLTLREGIKRCCLCIRYREERAREQNSVEEQSKGTKTQVNSRETDKS